MTDITILGLGDMGAALAATLLDKGHSVTVWNRTAAKADPLRGKGAAVARRVDEAVRASPVVIACLLDYAAFTDAFAEAEYVLRGKTLVNLTSGVPRQAREFAAHFEALGVAYVDGGILAVPAMIGGPGSLVLYAGDRQAFETALPLLEALGTARFMGEDAGLAALYDIALLSGMYGLFGGALHASALIHNAGNSVVSFMPMLQEWLSAMGGTLPAMAESIDANDHDQRGGSNLAMQATGLDTMVAASREHGVDPAFLLPMQALMRRHVEQGHGREDVSGLVRQLMTI